MIRISQVKEMEDMNMPDEKEQVEGQKLISRTTEAIRVSASSVLRVSIN